MYLEHFQLRELPFRLSPDPAFLYPSHIHSRAKAYMESTIWFTDGFVVITGEIGSGKTTLIETFLKEIDQDVVVAQINQTQVSPIEFLQAVLAQFGFSPWRMRKAELLATLNTFLIEQYANGRKVLLIVDEAQNLTNRVLEEVRLLSGVETTKEKVLRIILAGQPELNQKLDSQDLVQLRQRVRLRFHLSALTEPEMAAYINHRLAVAGATTDDLRAGDAARHLPLHGRHPATHQYPLRHEPARRLCPGPGHRRPGDAARCDRRTAVAGVRGTHAHQPRGGAHGGHLTSPASPGRAGRAAPAGRGTGACAAGAGPVRDRPDLGQRHAGRQQVREPPSRPARDRRRTAASSRT